MELYKSIFQSNPEWGDGMRVLIADDQAEVRSALKILLGQVDGSFLSEEAADAESLLERTEQFQPDLVLLDWELSGRGMADKVHDIRKRAQGTAIIALSGRPEAARTALMAGVDAFVSKGENSDALLEAIYTVRPGDRPADWSAGQVDD